MNVSWGGSGLGNWNQPEGSLGLARAKELEVHRRHAGPPEPHRDGGGCGRPLRIVGIALALFVLFGWAATLLTKFTGG